MPNSKLRVLCMAVAFTFSLVSAGMPSAYAGSAQQKCAAVGQKIKAAEGDMSTGEVVVTTALVGVLGLAISSAVKADNATKAGQAAEDQCLARNGLRAHCACPQMRECRGSWKTMACNDLVALCRDTPSNDVYAKNNCAKLKRLVKF